MSRDIAGTNSAPLTSELFHAAVYKPNQGRIVRQLTCLAIWVVVAPGLLGTLFDPPRLRWNRVRTWCQGFQRWR